MEAKEAEKSNQPSQSTNWLKVLVALILGLGLLWFAFKDCDFEKIKKNLQNLDMLYVYLICVSGVLSHLIRAARWIWLLKPVAGRNISLWNSFYAVILGYAVNVVVPRGGEVARLVSISKMEKLPWASVLPTMFIDRILDLVSLVVLIGISLTLLPANVLETLPWLVPGGIAMLVFSVIGLLLLPKTHAILTWILNIEKVSSMLPDAIKEKLKQLSEQFDQGTKSLSDPIAYPIVAGFTFLMWTLYGLNFYLMLFAFHIQDKVSIKNCLITLTIGSAGNVIPTPGTMGTFHLLVKETLVRTASLDPDLALSYAFMLHILCYVVVTCVPAAFCVAIDVAIKSRKKADQSSNN